MTFDSELRQKFLFENRNFTNSKRYFWALQSLRLFAEHIEGTMRSIPNIFHSVNLWDGMSEDYPLKEYNDAKKMSKQYEDEFEKLRDRIERKRLEIQSLSDGVSHLHSVNTQEIRRD